MQKKQSKSSKRNTDKIWKMGQDKNARKKHIREENCQEDLWQENYSDGQTRDITKNIGEDWKGIRDGRKENNQGEEKWK